MGLPLVRSSKRVLPILVVAVTTSRSNPGRCLDAFALPGFAPAAAMLLS
jgi:hypothetical protein